jgi:DNA-binding Lrp family transcriptional regulator
MLKFSDSHLRVLRCIQLQARISAREVGRACGMKESAVFYALRRFRSHGLLISRPLVNYSLLGFTEYDLYMRCTGPVVQARAQLISWAEKMRNVAVLAEVGGEYQFELVFVARSVAEVMAMMESLSCEVRGVSFEKSIALRTSSWFFGTKCIYPARKPMPVLGYDCSSQIEETTPLDHRMLGTLSGLEEFNVSRLARDLGQPVTTIEYRLRRLEERKVIAGYFYDFGPLNDAIGYLGFHLVVRRKGGANGFAGHFFDFCRKHPHIDVLQGGIGNWDYKLLARVPSYAAVLSVVDDIYEHFEAHIEDVRVLPMLKVHRVAVFPGIQIAPAAAQGLQASAWAHQAS